MECSKFQSCFEVNLVQWDNNFCSSLIHISVTHSTVYSSFETSGKFTYASIEHVCTVLNWGICKFVGGAIQWTFEHIFVSTTASHRQQQLFKLHATLSRPDLGTNTYIIVSCVKKLFCLVQAKKLTTNLHMSNVREYAWGVLPDHILTNYYKLIIECQCWPEIGENPQFYGQWTVEDS